MIPAVDLTGVEAVDLPERLAALHGSMAVDETVSVLLGHIEFPLAYLFAGAGFEINDVDRPNDRRPTATISATRAHTLADRVGPAMSVLLCGLNPSPSSAASGIGFFKAGNRFWPAALASGLVSVDRDPGHALAQHAVGMTDVVKRSTRRADEVGSDEFRLGLDRVRALVSWLRPGSLCMVGLAGWRAAVDRKAARGWQPDRIGGVPVYLMPSTSGLNAHDTTATLANHLHQSTQPPPLTPSEV